MAENHCIRKMEKKRKDIATTRGSYERQEYYLHSHNQLPSYAGTVDKMAFICRHHGPDDLHMQEKIGLFSPIDKNTGTIYCPSTQRETMII